MRCGLLLECHIFSVGTDFLCAATKNHLHAATAKAILRPADALRCTAFLDVSSLNFGSAHKALPFFCFWHTIERFAVSAGTWSVMTGGGIAGGLNHAFKQADIWT